MQAYAIHVCTRHMHYAHALAHKPSHHQAPMERSKKEKDLFLSFCLNCPILSSCPSQVTFTFLPLSSSIPHHAHLLHFPHLFLVSFATCLFWKNLACCSFSLESSTICVMYCHMPNSVTYLILRPMLLGYTAYQQLHH